MHNPKEDLEKAEKLLAEGERKALQDKAQEQLFSIRSSGIGFKTIDAGWAEKTVKDLAELVGYAYSAQLGDTLNKSMKGVNIPVEKEAFDLNEFLFGGKTIDLIRSMAFKDAELIKSVMLGNENPDLVSWLWQHRVSIVTKIHQKFLKQKAAEVFPNISHSVPLSTQSSENPESAKAATATASSTPIQQPTAPINSAVKPAENPGNRRFATVPPAAS